MLLAVAQICIRNKQTNKQTNKLRICSKYDAHTKEGTQSKKDVGFDVVHTHILLTLHTYIIHTSINSVPIGMNELHSPR